MSTVSVARCGHWPSKVVVVKVVVVVVVAVVVVVVVGSGASQVGSLVVGDRS